LSNWPNISVETKIAPVEALRCWLRAGVEFMATKKGMAALAMAVHGSSELVVYSLKADQTVGQLLRRAVAAGEIRAEIDPKDLLSTLVRMCYARQARLASQGAGPDRHLHRWTTRRPERRDDRQARDALHTRSPDIAVRPGVPSKRPHTTDSLGCQKPLFLVYQVHVVFLRD
jgi:hypothetical protein